MLTLRTRMGFLARLITLKLVSFLTLCLMSLKAPTTTNSLLNLTERIANKLAGPLERLLMWVGDAIYSESWLVPKKGALELMFKMFHMDRVLLFIGITITLYLLWLISLLFVRGVWWRITHPRPLLLTKRVR